MSTNQPFVDPGRLQLSFALLGPDGVRPVTSWHDFVGTADTDLAPDYQIIESASLTGNGFAARGQPGDIGLEKSFTIELNPRTFLYLAALTMGSFESTDLGGGAHRHLLSRNRANEFGLCGALRWSLGAGVRVLRPVFSQALTISWSGNNAHAQLQWQLAAERFDQVGLAEIVSATAPPAGSFPYVQGIPLGAELDAPDPDLYLRVEEVLPGQVKILAKLGAATAYDPGQWERFVIPGIPQRLVDETGRRLGVPGAYLEVYFDDITGLEVGHEWRLPLTRPEWVPLLATPVPMTSAMAIARVNGKNFAPTQGSIAITNPITFQTPGGSRFRDGAVNPIGPQSGIISLTRSSIDAQVLRFLEDPDAEFSIRVDLESPNRIGTTQHYHGIRVICDKCHVTDGTQALRIQSANQVQDQLVALSQPGAPAPYFDATNVEVVTDIGGLLG